MVRPRASNFIPVPNLERANVDISNGVMKQTSLMVVVVVVHHIILEEEELLGFCHHQRNQETIFQMQQNQQIVLELQLNESVVFVNRKVSKTLVCSIYCTSILYNQ